MIRAGEISAYRVWRYYTSYDGGIYLISYVSDIRWFPHRHVEVGLPLMGEQGIHGFKTMSDLRYDINDNVDLLVARGQFTPHPTQGVVIGIVDFWGEVWEHERGYRAQCARPTVFLEAHGENSEAVLARLRADFKV
jgi:hypothetical protein